MRLHKLETQNTDKIESLHDMIEAVRREFEQRFFFLEKDLKLIHKVEEALD